MYEFSGQVVAGEGRGKKLGFPTANLDNLSLNLNHGVYLVNLLIGADKKSHQGLLHFGPKKTFNNIVSVEIYINNFNKEIYGQIIRIFIVKKIRSIKKFKNTEDLIRQIDLDKKNLK